MISESGYLIFDQYYVNLDSMLPYPYMKFDHAYLDENDYNNGPKMNFDESLALVNGDIYSSSSYQDICFRQNRDSYGGRAEVCKYFVNRQSIIFDYILEDEKLPIILEFLEKDPLYLSLILTPNEKNKTPLDEAIANNSPKVVEMFLSSILKLHEFKLSQTFKHQFFDLFDMGVEAFRLYLNICYFTTGQMELMKKMKVSGEEDILRVSTTSSILNNKFNKDFLSDKLREKAEVNQQQLSLENKMLENSEDAINKNSETLVSDITIFDSVQEDEDNIFDAAKKEIRVEVKAIEFDWMLATTEGKRFLENLSNTDNLSYFEIDVIKDIILFQWNYFLPRILAGIFVPFLLFFALFIMYTTWILDEKFNEADSDGQWHITALVMGIIILVFQLFFIFINLIKFNFTKSRMIDSVSIILCITVVILDLVDVHQNDINAVSSLAVLLLWFRLFLMLRIFSQTAYLISMIEAIISEMKYFVLALLIAIFAFANTFFILGRNYPTNFSGDNVWDAFIFSYRMGLGDFNTDGFGTKDEVLIWTFWFLNTLTIMIILLNLVIAIMGDTFDRVQETQESTKLQEYASIIRENEFLVNRKRLFKNTKYMVIIQPEKAEGGSNTSWEGKLNQLKRYLEESS